MQMWAIRLPRIYSLALLSCSGLLQRGAMESTCVVVLRALDWGWLGQPGILHPAMKTDVREPATQPRGVVWEAATY